MSAYTQGVSSQADRLRDPAERWEIRYSKSEGSAFFQGPRDVFPRSPRRAEDLPPGALESLNDRCLLQSLRQLFIFPWAVRTIGIGGQKVISPECVLGIGNRAVGLWTEKPSPGVKVAIPLERISAIEDLTILLYGKLSFLSFSNSITIRYNALARSHLRPVLLDLRERLAGPPLPLTAAEEQPCELPTKWRRLVRSSFLRFREGAPVAYRYARASGRTGDDARARSDRGALVDIGRYIRGTCFSVARHYSLK